MNVISDVYDLDMYARAVRVCCMLAPYITCQISLSLHPSCTLPGPSHPLTNAHGCEIQQVAGGVSRDAGDAQVSEVNGPNLVLVVVQDAETAGAVGGIGALEGQKRLHGAEREKDT